MLIDNYEHIFNNGVITYQPDKSQKLNKSNKRLVKIFVGTWNVSNKPISKEFLLNDWLHPASEKHVLPDIYAVGFQVLGILNKHKCLSQISYSV